MTSVRLDSDLEARLKRAAQALDMSPSDFIRDALVRRCEQVLQESLAERLAPVIGIIESPGGRAVQTGAAFGRAVARRRAR
jgi:predicted transcriptional regulator